MKNTTTISQMKTMRKSITRISLLFFAFILLSGNLFAQGIKGTITNSAGEPLPFATIYIKQLETGTSTNFDGKYEFAMKPGNYTVYFQFLGYQTVSKEVTIKNEFLTMDIALKTQVMALKEVEVNARAEDPAYTIIRKAIAKSKYHSLQLDKYSCQVYIKGGARIKDVPWLLRKKLLEEGIDTSTVYLTESVNQITYERPNNYKERVISVRTIGGDGGEQNPMRLIKTSFYSPTVGESISPLSPKAFAYYKFKFEGSFIDRGIEVNKIRVQPRVRSEKVFSGFIYIVDGVWSIHSLDLTTYEQGFKFTISQIYNPIQEQVWLPVNHQFKVSGSFLGFDITYDYLATVSDYQITLNKELKTDDLVVVDEKIEKDLAKRLKEEKNNAKNSKELNTLEALSSKKEFTRKELRALMKSYEKEEEEELEEPDVVEYSTLEVDSLAGKKDSTYWATIRPVPLSKIEKKSYAKLDSIAIAEEAKKSAPDTVKSEPKKSSSFFKLFLGTSFKLGKKTRFVYKSPLSTVRFNSVEGYTFELPFQITSNLSKEKKLEFTPTLRYSFARDKMNGRLNSVYQYNSGKSNIGIEGGRYIFQYNAADPIHPIINSFASLLWERNYMKIYEKDYAKVSWTHHASDKFQISTSLEFAERNELFNNTLHSWREVSDRSYTANAPANTELANTSFDQHQAAIANVSLTYQPNIKYAVKNGRKEMLTDKAPVLKLNYTKGIKDIAGSDVDFDLLEVGIQHHFKLGAKGKVYYNLYAGSFLNANNVYFMDYKHFLGNRTFLQTSDPVGNFRLLDYYALSTQQNYVGGHAYYQFRRFLFTRIWEVRKLGLKENVIVNYLSTGGKSQGNTPDGLNTFDLATNNYMELGYSIDNIFKFFRIEAIASFQDFEYQDFGIRVGISTNIGELVSVD